MNLDLSPSLAAGLVVWGGLVLGLCLGAVGQATRFCVRGAIADWMIFRGPARMISWLLAIAVGALCVQLLVSTQLLDASRTIAWSDRLVWASYLAGGLLFGYGMVLAGGCPQRSLVKAGAGNLRAMITLLVIAVTAAMTLRGVLAGVRVSLFDSWALQLGSSQDVGTLMARTSLASAQNIRWALVAAMLLVAAGVAWRVRAKLDIGHVVGGVAVGLFVGVALFLTGGIGFFAEHPETLEAAWVGTQTRRPEGLSFSAPLAHSLDLLTLWTDKSMLATFGVTLTVGVLVGSYISARLRREFRLEFFSSPREFGAHMAGGMLMGFGGITALGCSIGNGVTGLALLSAGSMLAVAGICTGAWLALRLQLKRAEKA